MDDICFRINDVYREIGEALLPIDGYQNEPLVSLDKAVQPLISLFPENDLLTKVWTAKERCRNPADGLSQDESASIMLYTFQWNDHQKSLYFLLNKALREADRQALRPWFLYLRLFIDALLQLPPINDVVFRGVKQDFSTKYTPEGKLTWWGLSSCTNNIQTLQNEQFCGKTSTRTIFSIKCFAGRNIKNHSYYMNENEILLLPGRYLQVTGSYNAADGMHMIQLEEIHPPHEFLKLPPVKPWRRIESGASLLGMCTNPECNAHRKEVIIPIGFKTYDIVVDSSSLARCPMCTTYVNISKLGFNRCQWRLHGIRQQNSTSPPIPFLHERTQAPRHSLIEYNLKENETVWRQLILETIPEN